MTNFEKGVKVFAVTLAVIIIVSIVSAFLGLIDFSSQFFDDFSHDRPHTNEEYPLGESEFKDVSKIEVGLHSISLEVLEGKDFKIENYDTEDRVRFVNKNGILKIEEKDHNFWNYSNGSIKIYIPKDHSLSELDVEMGAGKAVFDTITLDSFDFEQGAGSLMIENCDFKRIDLDGGAGKMTIKNSNLRNLELESDVGSVDIEAYLEGYSDIDSGIGSVKIRLLGSKEDYSITAKKGIGSITIDGERNINNYGNGSNRIKIEGGTGSIHIDFEN